MSKKKGLTALLALVLALVMSFSAFAANKDEAKQSYAFSIKQADGTVLTIQPGQDWDTVHKALGKETSVLTLANCANGGSDQMFSYTDFDVYTTRDTKKNVIISSIELKGQAATEEGLKIGQAPAEVKKLYPSATESYGLYETTLGTVKIVIDCGIKNTAVERITYEIAPAAK